MIDTKAIAQARIDSALAKIERAQICLSEACGDLFSIQGMLFQHELVGHALDASQKAWAVVAAGRSGEEIDLDSATKRRLAAQEFANVED